MNLESERHSWIQYADGVVTSGKRRSANEKTRKGAEGPAHRRATARLGQHWMNALECHCQCRPANERNGSACQGDGRASSLPTDRDFNDPRHWALVRQTW